LRTEIFFSSSPLLGPTAGAEPLDADPTMRIVISEKVARKDEARFLRTGAVASNHLFDYKT